MHKLKTYLPSLKANVKKQLRSRVVYKLMCPGCNTCYVGQTSRHLITRFKEHVYNTNLAVRVHFDGCLRAPPTTEDISILASTFRNTSYLMTLEALFIREIKPELNTKDEYRSRELTIKF